MPAYSELSEARKAAIRANSDAARARLRAMPPALAAVHKIRGSLTGNADPYTPEERLYAEALRERIADLEKEAQKFHADVLARLEKDSSADGSLMREAVASAKALQATFLF